MTTTEHLDNGSDYFPSKNDCVKFLQQRVQTNPRYKNFKQAKFTCGDEEQFQQYRDASNGNVCMQDIPLDGNLFLTQSFQEWKKYKDLQADAVINTFRYIFHKFKKGIFVKIVDNKLRVFLPFSKAKYTNEWSEQIKVDKSKYGTMNDFIRRISEAEGRRFNPHNVNENIDEWYGNNCLVRYEYPVSEGESTIHIMKNMFEELCAQRKVPDIEFFYNRRDFPLITRDGTEPYNHIWGTKQLPLISHNYDQYAPILSMSSTDRFADILMVTWEDWARIQSYQGKWFPRACRDYNEKFNTPWTEKIPTAVFRGGTTGCGVTIDDNPRLKVAYLSHITSPDTDGIPLIDAGITNWNLRPRKLEHEQYLQTIEIDKLPFGLVDRLTPQEQSKYKYIINVDGHVTAYRLSLELSMGSVILLAKSPWKIWYSNLLVPYEHFVPIKEDLSDLIEQIKWCKNNDEKCQLIAQNAFQFFNKYLLKDGALDYMQKTLVDLKKETGVYLYNENTPLDALIEEEYKHLDFSYPETDKSVQDINEVPNMGRSYGLLQGFEWIVRKIIAEGDFEAIAEKQEDIFQNKLGIVRHFIIAKVSLAVKTTQDQQKIREHIHESYIGTKSINELTKYIPNFAYVFGLYRKNNTFNVVTERIMGQTLHEYIQNKEKFKFEEFLFILMQICLSLQMAQNLCGLVHYDLTPWNIMLQRCKKPQTFEYVISHNTIIRVRTSVIPIIIDYGKSHVIHEGVHHGFINMFKVSTSQDILTLLIKSIYQIAKDQHLPAKDFSHLLHLANFISGTKYRQKTFTTAKELRTFFKKVGSYSQLIESDKYELEKLKPYDLVKYIMKMRNDYKFTLGVVKEYIPHMDKGNARQVFEYILSSTIDEKIKTYENVYIRFKHCTLPQPKNLFFIYYAAQQLENNLVSVRDNMMHFLDNNNIDSTHYEKIFENSMRLLHRVYKGLIDKNEEENILYDLEDDFNTLIPAPYTEETFLLPSRILELFSNTKTDDLSDYKEIITMILLNQGTFQLNDKDRKYYLQNFSKLLSTSSLIMKNNNANNNTLNNMAVKIYSKDLEYLQNKLQYSKGDCEQAQQYLDIYRRFQ